MMRRGNAILISLGVLVLLAEAGRVLWYGTGAPRWEGEPVLVCRLPREAEAFDLAGSRASEVLSYDGASSVRLRGPGSPSWVMDFVHLEYEEGNAHVWHDLFTHPPEICFRASGARLLKTFESRRVDIDGQDLYFRHLLFEHPLQARPVHVFKAVWLARMGRLGLRGDEASYRQGRLAAARARSSPPGVVCLVMISEAKGPEHAWEILRQRAERWYRLEGSNP